MATGRMPLVPMGGSAVIGNAAVQRKWRSAAKLSSAVSYAEEFLSRAGFDRGPWLVVAFAAGITSWFVLDGPWQWCAAIGAGLLAAVGAMAVWQGNEGRSQLRRAAIAIGLMFAAGIVVIWARSAVVGTEAIDRPRVMSVQAYVLERQNQPALDRTRLVLALRDAEAIGAINSGPTGFVYPTLDRTAHQQSLR